MSKDPMRDLSGASGIGFTLVAYVLVFTAIGYGLDRLFKTAPWLMVVGVFAGAVVGFIYMIRTLTRPAGSAAAGSASQTETPGEDPDRDGRQKLVQIIVSVAVGVALALLYYLFSVRTTFWLAGKGRTTFPLLSVAAFLLRLTLLGAVFAVMALWLKPYLDLVAIALAFVAGFTVLTGFSLYRFAASGRTKGTSTRVMH